MFKKVFISEITLLKDLIAAECQARSDDVIMAGEPVLT
jgi:hypothetical protein